MLRRFSREESFQIAVACDQASNLRPRNFNHARTEHHVVPQIIDADIKSFERNKRSRRH